MLVLVLHLYVQLKIALQESTCICTVLIDEQIVSGLKCASDLSHIVYHSHNASFD